MNRREFLKCVSGLAALAATPSLVKDLFATCPLEVVECADALVTISDSMGNILASGYGKFNFPASNGSIVMSTLELVADQSGEAAYCDLVAPAFETRVPCTEMKLHDLGQDALRFNSTRIADGDDILITGFTIHAGVEDA